MENIHNGKERELESKPQKIQYSHKESFKSGMQLSTLEKELVFKGSDILKEIDQAYWLTVSTVTSRIFLDINDRLKLCRKQIITTSWNEILNFSLPFKAAEILVDRSHEGRVRPSVLMSYWQVWRDWLELVRQERLSECIVESSGPDWLRALLASQVTHTSQTRPDKSWESHKGI